VWKVTWVGNSGLLERDAVIASIEQMIRDVAAGGSAALYVLGEAGLGKTSVLDYARRQAGAAGLGVGFACGYPMETSLPFGLLMQALDKVGGRGLLSKHRTASSGDRAATFFRVLRWLQDQAGGPLVLAFDDVHWADADSVALLSFLCRRLDSLRLGILGTMRPWPSAAGDAAAALAHEGAAVIRQLSPLSEQAAAALLADRLGRTLPEAEQQRAFALCAGNPLLLEQLAVALARGEQVPALSSAGREAPGLAAFGQGVLLARFAGLPPAGMLFAQAAAVLGTSFLPEVAAEVAGLRDGDIDTALTALGRSGLIEQQPGSAADFLHPLFRQALYDDVAGPVRTRLHGRAFTVLHARGLDAQAAEHAVMAQLVGDPRAVAVLEQAGRAARRAGAFAAAVSHLDSAVAMAGDQAGVELLLAQGEALLVGGHPDRALLTYERLLSRSDCTGAARIQAIWMQGRALVMTGNHRRAASVLGDAADLARVTDPQTAVVVLLDAAFSALITQGPRGALAAAERASALAGSLGGGIRIRAEATLGEVLLQVGDPAGIAAVESAAPWHSEGQALSPESDPRVWGTVSSFAFGCAITERLAEADRAFTELRASAERASSPQAMAMLANGHGYSLMRMGRLPEALTAIEDALSLVELVPVVEAFAAVGSAYIQLYMGRLAESTRWCERVEAIATQRNEWNALLFLWDVRGHRCLREGNASRACDLYGQLEAMLERMGIGEPCVPPWGRHAITAYVSAGRPADAERVVAWLEQTRMPCRFPRIAAATGRALLAELAGDNVAAHENHRAALALHEQVDIPLDYAETLIGYGGFLRRSGQLAAARPVLTRAVAVAERTGARWLARLARDELKAAGGQRRRRSPGGLTAQEQRVARLAAAGASNAEVARQLYLSVSTVETHLEHIYAKLGIHSRYELIARAGELGAEQPPAKS
jgi:DNA-binding CsgD family transcriptional regulator